VRALLPDPNVPVPPTVTEVELSVTGATSVAPL
jgi:hypothetical protein